MKTHSNDRKFECMLCFKKFFDARTLKTHILTHADKPYSCQFCGKQFAQNNTLLGHLKTCQTG